MIDDWDPMFTRTDETEQAVRDSDLAAEAAQLDDFGADVFTSSWERLGYRSCPGCGADIGVSTEGPWHLPEDDCRAIRKPYPRKEQ